MENQQKDSRIGLALTEAANDKASDVHVRAGMPPLIRRGKRLQPPDQADPISAEEVQGAVSLLKQASGTEDSVTVIHTDCPEQDGVPTQRQTRWRATPFETIQGTHIAYRRIPDIPPDISDLGLPEEIRGFASLEDGLIIVAGATGSGKTTTLAAILRLIVETRSLHVLTIENPVEYTYPEGRALVSQREVPTDDYAKALKLAMRSDPDVVLLGECLTKEEFEGCMDLAMTGHLVLTTMHARDSTATCERIANLTGDPGRAMLGQTLQAVIAQRLLPTAEDASKRHCAAEVLTNSVAVRNFLKPDGGDIAQIRQHLSGKGRSLDRVLSQMVDEGAILEQTAERACIDKEAFSELREVASERADAGRTAI